ncbi:MAG TPA: ribosome biogenesis factor YjgA [Steroidobacteraceae bacterium]|nr:ribosome biogenesis factor YjgA [Steroidobacteraceae bacterium]
MRREASPDEDSAEALAERPSKSARKRAAHAAQDLGEQLVQLREAQLAALELPEALKEAVRAARSIKSRAAGARQRQYIGKLMRDVDPQPIRAALAARSAEDARATERFKRVESWRERLLAEGAPALAELTRWRPDIDQAEWARRVGAAQSERARSGAGGAASRELFRALRTLFDTMP